MQPLYSGAVYATTCCRNVNGFSKSFVSRFWRRRLSGSSGTEVVPPGNNIKLAPSHLLLDFTEFRFRPSHPRLYSGFRYVPPRAGRDPRSTRMGDGPVQVQLDLMAAIPVTYTLKPRERKHTAA